MHPFTPQGEIRPFDTVALDTVDYPSPVPLLRLRGRDREVIPPERCRLGPDCQVCQWRRQGLLEVRPDTRAA